MLRGLPGNLLRLRVPPLLNFPGVTHLDGLPVLRDGMPVDVHLEDGASYELRSPVINSVAGAIEIQGVIENLEWVNQPGSSVC